MIFKAISPHIPTDDPYSDEISNLTKITNIRIVLDKLHTLGDEMLDYRYRIPPLFPSRPHFRPEIDEKYYYAIYEMVIRGSCSCYGHASRCIALAGHDQVRLDERIQDVVHGKCECQHNTEGLNCEKCKDFYNDLPWRPAVGNETNECRRCECNGHAARCHFDKAVYEQSGGLRYLTGGRGYCRLCGRRSV